MQSGIPKQLWMFALYILIKVLLFRILILLNYIKYFDLILKQINTILTINKNSKTRFFCFCLIKLLIKEIENNIKQIQ